MNKERKITSIPISGLDTSTPAHLAKQGTCAELHNLRYFDNAWRPIPRRKEVATIQKTDNMLLRLLYQHPALPENYYIAAYEQDGMPDIGVVNTTLGPFEDIITEAKCLWEEVGNIYNDFHITHYGNVLIIIWNNQIRYFVWDVVANKYNEYTTPQPATIAEGNHTYGEDVKEDEIAEVKNPYNSDTQTSEWCNLYNIYSVDDKSEVLTVNNGKDNQWWGEVCYLVCYKMTDGTIVSPSELRILCSEIAEKNTYDWEILKYRDSKDKTFWALSKQYTNSVGLTDSTTRLRRWVPTINISIPTAIKDNPLIDKVCIYSTRIHTIFDYEKMMRENKFERGYILISVAKTTEFHRVSNDYYSMADAYANHKLPEQTLYLLEEKKISEISESWSVELGYDKFENITNQIDIFEANQTLHTIIPQALYQYNNRLHLGNISTKLFEGYNNITTTRHYTDIASAKLNILLPENNVQRTISIDYSNMYEVPRITFNGNIVSYPDYRAKGFQVFLYFSADGSGQPISHKEIALTAATANNYAYYIVPPTNAGKYTNRVFVNNLLLPADYQEKATIIESNRLQLSKLGNCFNLPFDQSYRVGNENDKIIAMNTTVEMLADSRYGETPLYVFTDNGIWAAIVGQGSVVYGSWVFINFDHIRNPKTVAANGSVFYYTDRGIFALQGRQTTLISQPIEKIESLGTEMAPAVIMVDMWYHLRHNELIVQTGLANTDAVLVYSLDNGIWYTQDAIGRKLNNNVSILDSGDALLLFDTEEYSGANTEVCLVTRPFELTPMRFTRIEGMWPRLLHLAEGQAVEIYLEGSALAAPDNWIMLHSAESGRRYWGQMRRCHSSARFYRITICAILPPNAALTHFDIEFYDRFLRRLR